MHCMFACIDYFDKCISICYQDFGSVRCVFGEVCLVVVRCVFGEMCVW